MLNLFRAEWQKISGNRWPTFFLLWIFPAGAFLFYLVIALILLFVPEARADMAAGTPSPWTTDVLGVWSLPANIIGRMFLIGFIAIVLAGEYQWGTWKNIIPRADRVRLILAKFAAIIVAVLSAFMLTALIFALGSFLLSAMLDQPLVPAMTADVARTFAKDFAIQGVLAFTSVTIVAGMVALAAMRMRTIVSGIMVGLAFSIGEPILFGLLLPLSQLIRRPAIFHFGRIFPFYNLDNASQWVLADIPSEMHMPADNPLGAEYAFTDSLTFSVVVLLIWVVTLTTLIVLLFNRQDITD